MKCDILLTEIIDRSLIVQIERLILYTGSQNLRSTSANFEKHWDWLRNDNIQGATRIVRIHKTAPNLEESCLSWEKSFLLYAITIIIEFIKYKMFSYTQPVLVAIYMSQASWGNRADLFD